MKYVIKTKNFVVDHKTAILVYGLLLTTTAAVVMRGGLAQHNAFLKEHGLYEEFYSLVD
jgi:hypothetical protein